MRRRLTRVGLAAAAMLLLAAAPAGSQDSGSERWNGSTLTAPAASDIGTVHVEAYFTRSGSRLVDITIDTVGGAPGCAPGPATGFGRTPTTFGSDLLFSCNGTYTVTALAETADDSPLLSPDGASRSATIALSMPAPSVTGVSASGSGRTITVVWHDMRPSAPDLSGYRVERRIGDRAYTQVAAVGSDVTSFVDDQLPSEAGEATYRVSSTRPSPTGTKVSAASSTEATPFVAGPTPPDGDGTTDPGDGTAAPGDGTNPGPGGAPAAPAAPAAPGTPGTPGTPGAAGPGVGGRPTGGSVRAPRLGITGSFLPPLLRPTESIQPPTTVDEGFAGELPYDDVEPGEDDPVLPDDELASVFTEDAAGRGMAIPVATALVLAVWAFHLRFLARAASSPGATSIRP